jgi:hypothetical protein
LQRQVIDIFGEDEEEAAQHRVLELMKWPIGDEASGQTWPSFVTRLEPNTGGFCNRTEGVNDDRSTSRRDGGGHPTG